MSRIVFLNGAFIPIADAKVSIMDRGFLFADGIYEVTAVIGGRLIDNDPHLARLDRSLREIGIPNPYSLPEWTRNQTELIRQNEFAEGGLYIEVTRGVFERDFLCPTDLTPTVVMFTQPKVLVNPPSAKTGIAVITVPDLRWKRRDIKSVALLPQVLAKQAARAANAGEAWMVENGYVTEGASSSAFIITTDKTIITRPLSNDILPGITRAAVKQLAASHELRVEERLFSVEEAKSAAEAFSSSASGFVMPIVSIDGHKIGDGTPGPLTRELRALYLAMAGVA